MAKELENLIQNYAIKVAQKLSELIKQDNPSDQDCVKLMLQEWDLLNENLNLASMICLHVDKTIIDKNIKSMGHEAFKKIIISHLQMEPKWIATVNSLNKLYRSNQLELLLKENNQQTELASLLKQISCMWVTLNLYYSRERQILQEAIEIYSNWAAAFLKNPENIVEYIQLVMAIVDAESANCTLYATDYGFLLNATK